MIEHDYQRGSGGYEFTTEEGLFLQNLRDDAIAIRDTNDLLALLQSGTLKTQEYQDYAAAVLAGDIGVIGNTYVGLLSPAYSAILAIIEGVSGVDDSVEAWIAGAADVNQREGLYGEFIHSWTELQMVLRGYSGDPSEVAQIASNDIGFALLDDLIRNRNLPDITYLGLVDAGSSAAKAFENLPFSPDGELAAWAGTLLFPFLGLDTFTERWLLPRFGEAGPVNATEQVSASYTDVNGNPVTKLAKAIPGSYDLFAALHTYNEIATSSAFSSLKAVLDFALNLVGLGPAPDDGSSANPLMSDWFADYYGLAADDPRLPGGSMSPFGTSLPLPSLFRAGSVGDDEIDANLDIELLHAGPGNDIVYSGFFLSDLSIITSEKKRSIFDGGAGVDTLDLSEAQEGLLIRFSAIENSDSAFSWAGEIIKANGPALSAMPPLEEIDYIDQFQNFERIILTSHSDLLIFPEVAPFEPGLPEFMNGLVFDGGDNQTERSFTIQHYGSVQTLSHFRSSDDGSAGFGFGRVQRGHVHVLAG